jgi:transcriptional regulator with XRE-family HTH domain
MRQGLWRASPALCRDCLAKWPDAPFGERLRAFRLAAGLTVRELAGRVGVADSVLHGCECDGGQRLAWSLLLRLARVLGTGLLSLGVEGPHPEA